MRARRSRKRRRRSVWPAVWVCLVIGLASAGVWFWQREDEPYQPVSLSARTVQAYVSMYPGVLEDEEIRQMEAFDNRTLGRTSKVKNQGTLGTCWAFASLTALEGRLLPEEAFDFSEDHMSRNKNFRLSQDEGGEYTMSMAYLLSWQGPVLEEQDPYGDGVSPEGLKPVKHVQEIQIYPEKNYDMIKEAIYRYGGVQSSLYTSLRDDKSDSVYYNKQKGSYYYDGDKNPNHDVVLIGWDDNYPKENFNIEPEGNGAFICANSWGDAFGQDGYFYVSYYDTKVGVHNIVYTRVETADNYEKIYQSDLCGWVGQLGYGKDTAWFANVYQSQGDEELSAAGFYATGPNTSYDIYIARGLEEEADLSEENRQWVGSGFLEQEGYYTIDFDQTVFLEPGERFGIVVKVTTPDAVHPVAIEYDAEDGKCLVDLSDGEGYISLKGNQWERVEKAQACNLCLKAYTR